jgi:hypothetical protein
MSLPNRYTLRLAERRQATERLPVEILEALARWTFSKHPIPIFIQICPTAYKALADLGLTTVREWLRRTLMLDTRTPIIFEVYR